MGCRRVPLPPARMMALRWIDMRTNAPGIDERDALKLRCAQVCGVRPRASRKIKRQMAASLTFWRRRGTARLRCDTAGAACANLIVPAAGLRSEEHTSELQSRENLVCRLL